MNRKICIIIMTLIIAVVFSVQAFASGADKDRQKLDTMKQEMEQKNKELDNIVEKLDKTVNLLEDLEERQRKAARELVKIEQELKEKEKELEKTQELLESIQNSIEETKIELEASIKEIESQQGFMDERLRAMYMSGPIGYFDILFESTSINDFVERLETLRRILQYDLQILASLTLHKENVEQKKEELEHKESEVVVVRDQIDTQRIEVQNRANSRMRLVRRLETEEEQYERTLKELDRDLKRLNDILKVLEKDIRYQEELIAKKSNFGELIPWPQVRYTYFPMFSNATVIDLITRKSFVVQRRGGSLHADVQPLTAKDTAIMKEIYGGSWSWNRRAIIVVAGGKSIAASMNGMPHPPGSITNNNFNCPDTGQSGHFCIHFYQSRIHGTNRECPLHQMMVKRAAGMIP